MRCPKCDGSFTGAPDAEGFFHCPQCGAKLRSRGAAPHTPPSAPAASSESGGAGASLERVLDEVRAIRRVQEEILGLLRAAPSATPIESEAADSLDDEEPPAPPAIRARRAKTVLVIDDQDETREQAVAALEQAQVPTRSAVDGPRGLEALAAERPDVIALELAIGGAMAGKDVINMIKATMEWIDIPIVLWTRLPIETQKEARTVHGADEVVRKGPGAAETLVARAIQLFRRG
jgi:CheY-like chemotaxis protein